MNAISGRWLSLRQAAAVSGRNAHTVLKLALMGRIAVEIQPGDPIRFRRADVEKLASERRDEGTPA